MRAPPIHTCDTSRRVIDSAPHRSYVNIKRGVYMWGKVVRMGLRQVCRRPICGFGLRMNCDPHHDMAIGVELHFDKAVITGSYTIKEKSMKETKLTLPEVALIGGTRVMLGAGIALLLSHKVGGEQRRAIG